MLVRPNKPVKKDDVLFRIDPTQYQAKVDQIAAQLKFTELREQQLSQLAARDAGSRFRVEETQAEVRRLKAQLSDAQWQLDHTTVHAPSDGFVTNVALRPGVRVTTYHGDYVDGLTIRAVIAAESGAVRCERIFVDNRRQNRGTPSRIEYVRQSDSHSLEQTCLGHQD